MRPHRGGRFVVPLLLLASVAVPTAAPGTEAPSARSSRADRLESADWVPLKGRIRVGRTWGHPGGHSFPAIDFEVPAGKSVPVFAAGSGTVMTAVGDCPDTTPSGKHSECNGGQGNLVEIVHPDGRRSRYLHLRFATVSVEQGEHVCRGCLIGRSGWSGNVSPTGPGGAHLHYEEIERFGPVDPGPMRALHRTRRVVYPRSSLPWRKVGGRGQIMRNTGFPPPGPAPTASCQSWAATRVGTAGPDQLVGTSGPDIIAGMGGNDSVRGLDGDDRICGGAGDDTLLGGANHDIIDGGDGTDTCYPDEQGSHKTAQDDSLLSCERPPYVLSVEVRCCLRSVTSEPAGIACPPDCTEPYTPGSVVRLTLSTGSASWTGCDHNEGGTNVGSTCTVTMRGDRHVTV